MPHNILVSGASSPIGNYFCHRLAEDIPDARITGLYRRNAPAFQAKNLTYLQLDFAEPIISLPLPFKETDTFLHLASVVPGNKPDGDKAYQIGNVEAAIRLIKAMLESGRLQKIFFLSSMAVYDSTQGLVLDENSPKTQSEPYGLSKLNFENELKNLHQYSAFQALGLRVPVLLVPGVKYNFFSKWKEAIAAGQPLSVANPDAAFNAVCPGWALYEACTTFMASGAGCSVANIAASTPTTLRKILGATGANWKERTAAKPPQTLATLHNPRPYPAFDALAEAVKFLAPAANLL